ncbi:hypothetical protein PPL_07071 [Heterostelium album PN500]|uniref:TNFR-Cys domain-containing protein n=1 Tax=Heterostelium pallidum (strain ATCC 26659 / Pp 5 / PN500) TaxID=670386 RepID=D3BEB5_HETP5|nr:hypothetical protein PPL_07071 [Heterostelium album PN500]EFA80246.1 hypothetical protein PPL_07071 [Heterostelium album PN500]|eukprot:XP_020432366.1 hypothetical protein PPL_07071 [Heterostelium album PN500]
MSNLKRSRIDYESTEKINVTVNNNSRQLKNKKNDEISISEKTLQTLMKGANKNTNSVKDVEMPQAYHDHFKANGVDNSDCEICSYTKTKVCRCPSCTHKLCPDCAKQCKDCEDIFCKKCCITNDSHHHHNNQCCTLAVCCDIHSYDQRDDIDYCIDCYHENHKK